MDINLAAVIPELLVVLAAVFLLMVGVHSNGEPTRRVAYLGVFGLGLAIIVLLAQSGTHTTTFGGMFVNDGFARFAKVMVLVATALAILMSLGFLERERIQRFEFPVMMLFAATGMMMMVSANDFIALYVGLETQSLALYVLAASQRDSTRATEAGLKYFILGSLASGMMLYGASLIYGFSGTTNFAALAQLFHDAHGAANIGVVIGIVFVLAGLAFKVSAVPFHMWTPDVYEGSPTPVTAFFAVAPKIAALCLLARVMVGPFGDLIMQWRQVVVFIAIASMILGSFAGIAQRNIKRLMAYSSIGHVGYALMGVAVGDAVGVRGMLVYLAIYLVMNVGTFAIILSMRQKGRHLENIDDLAGLSKTNPMMALAMAIFMFSMAGVPPMAGFLAKVYVFMAAIDAGLVTLAVIGVLTSVVSAFYYLRVIKVMYFDEPIEAFDRPVGRVQGLVMTASAVAILVLTLVPSALVASAEAAAATLFAG